MAKTAKNTTTPKSEPKPSTATVGNWDFSGKDVDEVPTGLGRANNTQKLPFPWDHYATTVKVSKMVEIPLKFWTEGRGYEAADCTPQKCRERVQRAFYGWKSHKDHKKAREKFTLGFADQFDPKGGAYTGTHMYFQVAKP